MSRLKIEIEFMHGHENHCTWYFLWLSSYHNLNNLYGAHLLKIFTITTTIIIIIIIMSIIITVVTRWSACSPRASPPDWRPCPPRWSPGWKKSLTSPLNSLKVMKKRLIIVFWRAVCLFFVRENMFWPFDIYQGRLKTLWQFWRTKKA